MPFTTEQFLKIFAQYNAAIWPAQFVLAGAAVLVLYLAVRGHDYSATVGPWILAALWAWSGVVYHLMFFRRINQLAVVFGALFLVQAVLLLLAARRRRLNFAFRATAAGWLGGTLITYALVVYPLLGAAQGRWYPSAPTFGVPCPLTIFTLGLLLWNTERTPWYVMVVPLLWSAIGTSAALSLGIREDFGLGLAGVVTLTVLVMSGLTHRLRPAIHS
jgi:hypothetical protein